MSDMVTVRIQLRGQWEYCGEVEMSREDYEKWDKKLDDAGGREYARVVKEISGLFVDQRDIEMDDADDLDDFCIIDGAPP